MNPRFAPPGWLRRPAVVSLLAPLCLAALLFGSLAVARAVDGAPAAETSASSPSSGGDNIAGAVNSKDGKTVYAIKLKIVRTSADTVDSTNAAIAVNKDCTDCSTVAIAFEAIIVTGSPSTFTPTNLAIAYNENCTGCTAFADAYQQVVQTSTKVRITKQGRKEIARIRKDLKDIKKADLTLAQIQERVAAAHQAFATVLRTQIVPVGNVKDAPPADAPDLSDDPEATTAEPAANPDTSASPSSDTATPSPTATTAPTDSSSSSPSPAASSAPPASTSPTPSGSAP